MAQVSINKNAFVYLLLALLTYCVALYLLYSGFTTSHPLLIPAITIDLTITTTFFLWLFLLRQNLNPLITGILFVSLLIAAKHLIPDHQQSTLEWLISYAFPLLELTILGTVFYQFIKGRQHYQKLSHLTFPERMNAVLLNIFKNPLAARLAVTEITMFYYLLIRWQRPANGISYHKKSGITAILVTVAVIAVAEAFVVHLVLMKYSLTLAWILTGLSIYSFLQIISLTKSILLEPVVFCDDFLQLKYGWLKSTRIYYDNICTAEINNSDLPDRSEDFVFMGLIRNMEYHGVFITLKNPVTVNNFIGIQMTDKVFFPADEADKLAEQINQLSPESNC